MKLELWRCTYVYPAVITTDRTACNGATYDLPGAKPSCPFVVQHGTEHMVSEGLFVLAVTP